MTTRATTPASVPGTESVQKPLATVEDMVLHHRVERFYAFESGLLDDREFTTWLTLFTEDCRYWIPTRMTVPVRDRHREIASEHEPAVIDDDIYMLRGRVRRLLSIQQWSEEPPSRTRHLVTNVRVEPSDGGFEVQSNFIVYRTRSERHEDWFIGTRRDRLVVLKNGRGFQIARRYAVLDQTTMLVPSMSIFV